jgi:5'(3')-deoxyribonucleotidase
MMPFWLKEYSKRSGELIKTKVLNTYWLRQIVSKPEIIDEILHEEGFFLDKPAMPGAVYYLRKLMEDDRFDVVVLTQPPRRADHAVREKRIWMQGRFPKYELSNMIFAHRKDMVRGDLLFDDCPDHIVGWKKRNPRGITATINYNYNLDTPCTVRFNKRVAWEEFYDFVTSLNW